MKKVLVPLAPGFEEIEAVTIIDVLRRAAVEVVVAGTVAGPVRGSRGVTIVPDATFDQVDLAGFDAIALPGGGPGAAALRADERVRAALACHHAAGRLTAAICAAPTVLAAAGLVAGRRVTGHPSVHEELARDGADVDPDRRVVVDGHLITSQGPGTSLEFALALVERLAGPAQVEALGRAMLVANAPPPPPPPPPR